MTAFDARRYYCIIQEIEEKANNFPSDSEFFIAHEKNEVIVLVKSNDKQLTEIFRYPDFLVDEPLRIPNLTYSPYLKKLLINYCRHIYGDKKVNLTNEYHKLKTSGILDKLFEYEVVENFSSDKFHEKLDRKIQKKINKSKQKK